MLIKNIMIDIAKDIDSLSNFKRNTAKYVKQMKKSGTPVVLTVNGKAQVVVQDAESYQRLLERLEKAETVVAINKGIKDFREGNHRPAREVLENLKLKYDI